MKIAKLKNLIISIFKNYDLSNEHAKICANALVNAELVGAPSHGAARVVSYCNRIKKKVINPKPKIKIKKISQSITQIDTDNAVGFVGADLGINNAILNAKKIHQNKLKKKLNLWIKKRKLINLKLYKR